MPLLLFAFRPTAYRPNPFSKPFLQLLSNLFNQIPDFVSKSNQLLLQFLIEPEWTLPLSNHSTDGTGSVCKFGIQDLIDCSLDQSLFFCRPPYLSKFLLNKFLTPQFFTNHLPPESARTRKCHSDPPDWRTFSLSFLNSFWVSNLKFYFHFELILFAPIACPLICALLFHTDDYPLNNEHQFNFNGGHWHEGRCVDCHDNR